MVDLEYIVSDDELKFIKGKMHDFSNQLNGVGGTLSLLNINGNFSDNMKTSLDKTIDSFKELSASTKDFYKSNGNELVLYNELLTNFGNFLNDYEEIHSKLHVYCDDLDNAKMCLDLSDEIEMLDLTYSLSKKIYSFLTKKEYEENTDYANLSDVLKVIHSSVKKIATENYVDLVYFVDSKMYTPETFSDLEHVLDHSEMIQDAFLNLIKNAVEKESEKFYDQHKQVCFKLDYDKIGNKYKFQVLNSSELTSEERSKIFAKNGSTKVNGTGYGTINAKETFSKLNGYLSFASQTGLTNFYGEFAFSH